MFGSFAAVDLLIELHQLQQPKFKGRKNWVAACLHIKTILLVNTQGIDFNTLIIVKQPSQITNKRTSRSHTSPLKGSNYSPAARTISLISNQKDLKLFTLNMVLNDQIHHDESGAGKLWGTQKSISTLEPSVWLLQLQRTFAYSCISTCHGSEGGATKDLPGRYLNTLIYHPDSAQSSRVDDPGMKGDVRADPRPRRHFI